MGMNLLTGEYNNTIDDKGRVSFPVKLRAAINQNVLIVTKGSGSCLWLFTAEEWDSFQSKIMGNASIFNKENMMVVHKYIAPAQDIEFDKNGRLSIPQSLREYAGLTKDITILGMAKFVEIWDAQAYRDYLAACDESGAEENFSSISF